MESIEESELPSDQQLFNRQLELEHNLRSINNDLNANQNESQTIIYQYLDHILEHNLITIQDFGNDLEWLNVERCLSLDNDLKGLLLVIDFFTYCCINCLHVLPQLNAIDKLYQNEGLLVLGIHSPKFDNEKDVTNVGDAILKYDISHPVANDPLGKLWTSLSVQCWPTLVILGPNSQILFTLIGENGIQEWLQLYTKTALNYFKLKNMIITENKFKIPMKLLRNELKSELEFPGKISASSDQQLLAISDTKHHNIIIAKINGFIKYIIGGNKSGLRDGTFTEALFNNPQGIVWKNNHILYVADTENHAIRMIDLNNKTVITLTGNGKQSYDRIGGNIGTDQGLNSPWDLCYEPNNRLFIAMAGSHQIWVLSLEDNTQILNKFYPKGCCFCFAGDGVEQNRNNIYPLKASFAQPSGLAFDSICNCLYVADSESSSVRCVDISTGAVKALVGGHKNPLNLFAFGDLDGKGIDCRLQHCLGIAFDSNTQSLFVADSYNHKIKQIVISSKECISIAGIGQKGNRFECKLLECSFNEPNGLCLINGGNTLLVTDTNNHCLKRLDLENDFVTEFKLINFNEKITTDCVDRAFTQKNVDFNINLNAINLNVKNKLKLQLKLDFDEGIKPTTGAKHSFSLFNPDETIFCSSHKRMQTENLEELPHFLITAKNKLNDERLTMSHTFIVYATLNLCNTDLNYCKQILIAFNLPLFIVNNLEEEEETTITINLPFHLKTL